MSIAELQQQMAQMAAAMQAMQAQLEKAQLDAQVQEKVAAVEARVQAAASSSAAPPPRPVVPPRAKATSGGSSWCVVPPNPKSYRLSKANVEDLAETLKDSGDASDTKSDEPSLKSEKQSLKSQKTSLKSIDDSEDDVSLPDFGDSEKEDSEDSDTVMVSLPPGSSQSTAAGSRDKADDLALLAAEKKALKRQGQKEKKAKAKAEAKAKLLAENLANLALGSMVQLTKSGKVKPQPKRLFRQVDDWKNIKCSMCPTTNHWRYMPAVWSKIEDADDPEEGEVTWNVVHYCVPCRAKVTGKSEEEIYKEYLETPIEKKKWRANNYKEALNKKREEFAMQDGSCAATCSKRKMKMLSRESLSILLEPLSGYILRKQEAMEAVVKDVQEHARLRALLMAAKSIEEEKTIMELMDKLERDDKYLAFAEKIDQHAWITASSFSDEWTVIRDAHGRSIGGICSYYPCFGKTRWMDHNRAPLMEARRCCRIIPSKMWGRKHSDPLASKQKYYCYRDCNKKFEAPWGQLVEVRRVNTATGEFEIFYMRAEVPSWDVEDIRAMHLEDTTAAGCQTAADLFNKLKSVAPSKTSLVVDDPQLDDVRMFLSYEHFMALPEFSWWEIFTFAGTRPPKGCKKPAGV